jgi:hypothetical protein
MINQHIDGEIRERTERSHLSIFAPRSTETHFKLGELGSARAGCRGSSPGHEVKRKAFGLEIFPAQFRTSLVATFRGLLFDMLFYQHQS